MKIYIYQQNAQPNDQIIAQGESQGSMGEGTVTVNMQSGTCQLNAQYTLAAGAQLQNTNRKSMGWPQAVTCTAATHPTYTFG